MLHLQVYSSAHSFGAHQPSIDDSQELSRLPAHKAHTMGPATYAHRAAQASQMTVAYLALMLLLSLTPVPLLDAIGTTLSQTLGSTLRTASLGLTQTLASLAFAASEVAAAAACCHLAVWLIRATFSRQFANPAQGHNVRAVVPLPTFRRADTLQVWQWVAAGWPPVSCIPASDTYAKGTSACSMYQPGSGCMTEVTEPPWATATTPQDNSRTTPSTRRRRTTKECHLENTGAMCHIQVPTGHPCGTSKAAHMPLPKQGRPVAGKSDPLAAFADMDVGNTSSWKLPAGTDTWAMVTSQTSSRDMLSVSSYSSTENDSSVETTDDEMGGISASSLFTRPGRLLIPSLSINPTFIASRSAAGMSPNTPNTPWGYIPETLPIYNLVMQIAASPQFPCVATPKKRLVPCALFASPCTA